MRAPIMGGYEPDAERLKALNVTGPGTSRVRLALPVNFKTVAFMTALKVKLPPLAKLRL
jgi:hypothetical protein